MISKNAMLALAHSFNARKIENRNLMGLVMPILQAAELQSIVTTDGTINLTDEVFQKLANLRINFTLPESTENGAILEEVEYVNTSIFHAMLELGIIDRYLPFASKLAQHMHANLLYGKFIKDNKDDIHILKSVIENIYDEQILEALINKTIFINQKLKHNYTLLHIAYANKNDIAFELIMKHENIIRGAEHNKDLFDAIFQNKENDENAIETIVKLSQHGFYMTKEFVNKLTSKYPDTVNKILPSQIKHISNDNLKALINQNKIDINRKAVFGSIMKGEISFLHSLYLQGCLHDQFDKQHFEIFELLLKKSGNALNKDPQFNADFWIELYQGPRPNDDGHLCKKHRLYAFDILIEYGFTPPNYIYERRKTLQSFCGYSSALYSNFEPYGLTSSFTVFTACTVVLDIAAIAPFILAALIFEIPLLEVKTWKYCAYGLASFSTLSFAAAYTNTLPKFIYQIADSICIYFTATKEGMAETQENELTI